MKISVIIPTFNSRDSLSLLLQSIDSSSYIPDEIIVVDDASTDTTTHLKELENSIYVRLPERYGPAYARNIGAAKASGDILIFFDADVIVFQNTIQNIVACFAQDKELVALSGIYSEFPANSGFFPRYKALLTHYWFQDAHIFESFETACAAIYKNVFLAMGGFSTIYKSADVEDYEFGYRISAWGKLRIFPFIQVKHHFPGFFKNAKNFYKRTIFWLELFAKRRCFDSTATSKGESFGRMAEFFTGLLFLGACISLIITGKNIYLFISGLFVLFCLFLQRKFYRYLWQKENGWFALRGIGVHFINSMVIGFATGHFFMYRLYRAWNQRQNNQPQK